MAKKKKTVTVTEEDGAELTAEEKSLFGKMLEFKEMITLIISLIAVSGTGWTYITTKFALKENVDYNQCINDRNFKFLDAKWGSYLLNEGMNELYSKEAQYEQQYKDRSVPISEYAKMKELNDIIVDHKQQIKDLDEKRKTQENRDCLNEVRNVKKD